jgi:hypothetical protein
MTRDVLTLHFCGSSSEMKESKKKIPLQIHGMHVSALAAFLALTDKQQKSVHIR